MRLWLKQLREREGKSQQQIADKLGITRQYYQMIESGERQQKMDITLSVKLAAMFKIPITEIVEFENEIKEDTK